MDGARPHSNSARALAALVALAFVLTQVVAPAVNLLADGPMRFGWQMYARPSIMPEFRLRLGDGTARAVDPSAALAAWRADLDLDAALPPYLCRTVPEADAVEIRRPGAREPEIHRCG
jgi:hypothetical protein